MNDTRALRPSLARDSSGTILLIGLVAGALLVGTLWHLVGVGDAILWRERAQDAADSAAFQASVIQARGMNVLVVLNMIMALVMSVLVAWRVVEILIGIALVVVAIVSIFTAGAASGLSVPLGKAAEFMWRNDPKVSDYVVKICAGVNVLEKLVATVTPPIAMGHAMVDTHLEHDVSSVFAVTPSIGTPTLISENLAADGFKKTFVDKNSIKQKVLDCFQGRGKDGKPGADGKPGTASGKPGTAGGADGKPGTGGGADGKPGAAGGDATPATGDGAPAAGASAKPSLASRAGDWVKTNGPGIWEQSANRRMGFLVSLPVQEDGLGTLCGKASVFWDSALIALVGGMRIDGLASALEKAGKYKEKLFSMVPNLFCSPTEEALQSLESFVSSSTQGEIDSACQQAEEEFRAKPEAERKKDKFYKRPGGLFDDVDESGFNRKQCREEQKKQQEEAAAKAAEGQEKMGDAMACVKPSTVWEMAQNGNVFMQSFSWVNKGTPLVASEDRGLEVGDRQQTGSVVPVEPGTIRAQGEMYFDCEGAWSDCKSNAMWQVKWKARLRRVQPLSRMAGQGLAHVLAIQISGVLNTVANEFLGKVPELKDNPLIQEEMGKRKGELQSWLYDNNPTSSTGANAREIH